MSAYTDCLNAVENYYANDIDAWKAFQNTGLSGSNTYSNLHVVPNVNTTVSQSGNVIDFHIPHHTTLGDTSATAINSNTELPSCSVDAPLNTVVDTNGKVSSTASGIGTTATGLTAAGTMSKWALGGTIGLAIGASALAVYDIHKDLTNHEFSKAIKNFNDAWKDYTTSDDTVNVYTRTEGKKATTYVSKNVLTNSLMYLLNKGVYDSDTCNTNTNLLPSTYPTPILLTKQGGVSSVQANGYSDIDNGSWIDTKKDTNINITFTATDPDVYLALFNGHINAGMKSNYNCVPVIYSNNPFAANITYEFVKTDGTLSSQTFEITATKDTYTIDGKTYYGYGKTLNAIFASILNAGSNVNSVNTDSFGITSNIVAKLNAGVVFEGLPGVKRTSDTWDPSDITDRKDKNQIFESFKKWMLTKNPTFVDNVLKHPQFKINPIGDTDIDMDNELYPMPTPKTITNNYISPNNYYYYSNPLNPDSKTVPGNSVYNPSCNEDTDSSITNSYTTTIINNNTTTTNNSTPNSGNSPIVITPSGTASALYTIYNPTISQINSFGAWLWSTKFSDQLLKVFSDPMQAIIGLHKVYATPSISGSSTIKVGYLDSGVSSNIVNNQYTTIDCGTIHLSEHFNNVFDYSPYTSASLYLPFIGIVNLNINDIMRGDIQVVYHVDVLSGACYAEVNVYRDNKCGGTLYTYSGNASVECPLSSGSYMGIASAITSIAGSAVATMASGGAAAPLLFGSLNTLSNAHTNIERSGSISGSFGAMGCKKPYLILTIPQISMADNYEKYIGIPSNEEVLISSLSGFCKLKNVHLTNIDATNEEKDEITNLLSTGILI